MTVGELFKELRWEAVEKAIVALYPDERPALPAYKEVFTQVREKEPSRDESGMVVHIKFVPESDFNESHYSVDGKKSGGDETYALDLCTFAEWAAYLLSEDVGARHAVPLQQYFLRLKPFSRRRGFCRIPDRQKGDDMDVLIPAEQFLDHFFVK